MKETTKRKYVRKKPKFSDYVSADTYRRFQEKYTQTQIQEILAEKYKVSPETVRKDMRKKGVTIKREPKISYEEAFADIINYQPIFDYQKQNKTTI